MYNYQILLNTSKTEIYEKLILMSLYTNDYETYVETADNLTWLFTEMDPEVKKYFFPEESEVKNV